MKKVLLVGALLLVNIRAFAADAGLDPGSIPLDGISQTFMFTHPATFDVAREQAMWHNFIYNKRGPLQGALQVIPFFQKSIVSDNVVNRQAGYFMPTCVSQIVIAGDATGMNLTRDVRAEWLGLPSNFSGIMKLTPEQTQYGAIIEYNQSVSRFTENHFFDYFWVSFTMPIQTVKNNLNIRQQEVENPGTSQTPAHPNDIIEAFVQPEWEFAKINGEMKESGIGECKFKLGGVLYAEDGFEVDFYELLSIPTSSKQDPRFLFSPYLSNNKHWVIGSGVNFQFPLTRAQAHCPFLFFFNIEHQFFFRNDQFRTFDLIQKPWSRYLLYNSIDGSEVNVPGVNILTRHVRIKPDSFVDLSTGFRVDIGCCEMELAYDLWAHGQERVEFMPTICPECHQEINPLIFGIAGTLPGTSASSSTIRIRGPNDPKFMTIGPFDIDGTSGVALAAISHRVHGSVGIAQSTRDLDGFINFGAFAEFSQNNAALSLWGVWGKLGAAF